MYYTYVHRKAIYLSVYIYIDIDIDIDIDMYIDAHTFISMSYICRCVHR